jgi:hypothetical protein
MSLGKTIIIMIVGKIEINKDAFVRHLYLFLEIIILISYSTPKLYSIVKN